MQLDVGLGKDGAASLPSLQDFFGSVPERPQVTAPKKPRVAEGGAAQAAGRRSSKGEKRKQKQEGGGGGAAAAAGEKRQRSGPAEYDGKESAGASGENEGSLVSEEDKMARTVFVGGVPLAEEGRLINPKTIKGFFRDCGDIESVRLRSLPVENPVLPKKAAIAMGKINGKRETCNAYVVFKSKESVAAALLKDGAAFGDEGHRIRVDGAKPPGEGGKTHNIRLSVFVGNVPFNAEDEALRGHFGKCGEITNVRVVRDPKTLIGKGFAYVTFADCDAVSSAMQLNGSKLLKRELRVARCSKKPTSAQLGGAGAKINTKGANKGGQKNRMGAEYRRRIQRDEKRAGNEGIKGAARKSGGKPDKAGKPGATTESKAAKLKKKEKYLKIQKTPKFKDRKKDKRANNGIKGSAVTKGEKRRGKDKKNMKLAKKALKGKKRKV